MTTSDSTPSPKRRRGPELEAALLEAAWNELVEVGFAKLTMESIAYRASTGIAVLYRRWANKDELVLAALEQVAILDQLLDMARDTRSSLAN